MRPTLVDSVTVTLPVRATPSLKTVYPTAPGTAFHSIVTPVVVRVPIFALTPVGAGPVGVTFTFPLCLPSLVVGAEGAVHTPATLTCTLSPGTRPVISRVLGAVAEISDSCCVPLMNILYALAPETAFHVTLMLVGLIAVALTLPGAAPPVGVTLSTADAWPGLSAPLTVQSARMVYLASIPGLRVVSVQLLLLLRNTAFVILSVVVTPATVLDISYPQIF